MAEGSTDTKPVGTEEETTTTVVSPEKTNGTTASAETRPTSSAVAEKELSVPIEQTGSEEEEEDDGTANHVHGIPLILLAFGLCVTTFLIGLDQMIIATAIPKITTQFRSLADVGW